MFLVPGSFDFRHDVIFTIRMKKDKMINNWAENKCAGELSRNQIAFLFCYFLLGFTFSAFSAHFCHVFAIMQVVDDPLLWQTPV